MTEHCSDCGTELVDGSKFCSACGKSIEILSEAPKKPEPQKQDTQQKTPKPLVKTLKKKKKLIIGISALLVAVVVGIILIGVLLGGTNPFGGADSRFLGEWEENTLGTPLLWRFNSDSTLETGFSESTMSNRGTWKGDTTLLCLYNSTVCYVYEFSNNGNMLTLNIAEEQEGYPAVLVLTKKGQQGTDQTPTIECLPDAATNRIIITQIDENVKWNDIQITTNPSASWQVQDINNKGLAKIGITATITTYITIGDSLLILDANGDVMVTFKYLPTNTVLGNWTVNV